MIHAKHKLNQRQAYEVSDVLIKKLVCNISENNSYHAFKENRFKVIGKD